MRYLPFVILLFACSSPEIDHIEWGGNSANLVEGNWTVTAHGVVYPGNSSYIKDLIEAFDQSEIVEIGSLDKELLSFYGIISNRIGHFLVGNKLPGELGRYLYNLENHRLYRAFGNLNEYDVFYNLKDLDLSSRLTQGEVLFISLNNRILLDNDASLFFNNILRSDIKDLIPNRGETIVEAEIKYTNGRIINLEIKKGEQGYSINLGSPFSYIISQEDYNIISSF